MSEPLREFLRSDPIVERLQSLRTLSPSRFITAVVFNYALIALAIAIAVKSEAILISPNSTLDGAAASALPTVLSASLYGVILVFAIVVIAARQHALLVLMHEGAHRSISRNRALNDTLSDLLCGAPLLVSTRSYRHAHLAHHQHLNSPQDPDWCRKVDNPKERSQWLFPAHEPLWKLLATLYGHSVLYLLKSLSDNQRSDKGAEKTTSLPAGQPTLAASDKTPTTTTLTTLKYLLYAAVGVILTVTSSWLGFVMFWLAPMLLALPLIMRIRSIAEHFALRHDHPLRQTRTVRAGWLERLLLAPHHIGLHIDHHLLASVPFYQLPKLHQLLMECPDYADNAHLNDGYFVSSSFFTSSYSTSEKIRKGQKGRFAADLYGCRSQSLQPTHALETPNSQAATG